jgi:NAD(P)-dependent dehydrogenase (short-subunit alcohol dehydrogenase family)
MFAFLETNIMNVIVTGASAGIGYELVKKLIDDPGISKVIGIARREKQLSHLQTYADEAGMKNKYISLIADVMDVSLGSVAMHVDRVDVLINNAGLLKTAPFADMTDADILEVYTTNVFAPARLIRTVLPLMGKGVTSHVVNIGSMGGFQGSAKFSGLAAYSSSKAALAGLSECLAEEFQQLNVKVNCLALGAVQTEMLTAAFPGFHAPTTADAMAEFIAYFACNAHKYMNGKVIPVSCSTP